MSAVLTGSCLCGNVRYECTESPESSTYCHCRNCQKAHAAPYAVLALVSPASLSVAGELTRYERIGDSGKMTFREFCPKCGSQLFSGSVDYPQILALKIMTLDNPDAIAPSQHVWVENAVEWVCLKDGLPHVQQRPVENVAEQVD
jgi:hypothetical protein